MAESLWTVYGIPVGWARRRTPGEGPSPEYVQANLFTLTRIGGVYDDLAFIVEEQHRSILDPWRLDSGAPSVRDYLEARDADNREDTHHAEGHS